ncbi:MAG: ferritin [Nanoarchaeota archaeon]|nr:ferritin [Nanoarchaeota archaeon]
MLQEDSTKLSDKVQDLRRAIDSLREELEAVDHYEQRAEVCKDGELKKILLHNSNEEKEHAAMLSAWIKKHDPNFKKEFDEYMNAGDIVGKEERH